MRFGSRPIYFDGAQVGLGLVPVEAVTSGIAGSGAVTEADDTLSAVGQVAISGTGAPTEADDTASGQGAVAVSGAGAVTEADDTAAGTGTVVGGIPEIVQPTSGGPDEYADALLAETKRKVYRGLQDKIRPPADVRDAVISPVPPDAPRAEPQALAMADAAAFDAMAGGVRLTGMELDRAIAATLHELDARRVRARKNKALALIIAAAA